VSVNRDIEEDKYIDKIKDIMYGHDITSLDAKKIYDSAKGDIEIISKVYNHFKNKKVENFIGAMISMVKPGTFQEPIYNAPKNKFNDYDQRRYDYDELEKKLLG
jgi:transaldolase